MRKILRKLKSSKGDFSIPYMILILAALIFATSYFRTIKIDYALNEVQSMLDMVGVATLQESLSSELLKDEIFGLSKTDFIDKNTANSVFKNYEKDIKLFYKNNLYFNRSVVPSYNVDYQKIYFDLADYEFLGETGDIPQIILESIVTIELNVKQDEAEVKKRVNSFYSSRAGKTISVENVTSTPDGHMFLTLRSTVRATYN